MATGTGQEERVEAFRQGAARWNVLSAWRDRLFSTKAPNWFCLDDHSLAFRIKSGHGRTVWRVEFAGVKVFAKVFEVTPSPIGLRRIVSRSPALREWRSARAVHRRGVAVIKVLAVGRHGGRCVLVSQALEDARSLTDAWHHAVSGVTLFERRRRTLEVIESLASLFADAHQHGFCHLDGHPDNIVIYANDSGGSAAAFVDIHPVSLHGGCVPNRRAIRSFAQLDHSFQRTASRSERLKFLRRYCAKRDAEGFHVDDLRQIVADISRAKQVHATALAGTRDRRLRGDGKYFAAISLGNGWRGTVALRLERRHVFPEPDIPDRTAREWERILNRIVESLTSSGTLEASRTVAGFEITVARASSLLERADWTISGSPARHVFLKCHRGRHRDLRAKLVLGYLEHRSRGLIDQTLVIRPERACGAGAQHVSLTE